MGFVWFSFCTPFIPLLLILPGDRCVWLCQCSRTPPSVYIVSSLRLFGLFIGCLFSRTLSLSKEEEWRARKGRNPICTRTTAPALSLSRFFYFLSGGRARAIDCARRLVLTGVITHTTASSSSSSKSWRITHRRVENPIRIRAGFLSRAEPGEQKQERLSPCLKFHQKTNDSSRAISHFIL